MCLSPLKIVSDTSKDSVLNTLSVVERSCCDLISVQRVITICLFCQKDKSYLFIVSKQAPSTVQFVPNVFTVNATVGGQLTN